MRQKGQQGPVSMLQGYAQHQTGPNLGRKSKIDEPDLAALGITLHRNRPDPVRERAVRRSAQNLRRSEATNPSGRSDAESRPRDLSVQARTSVQRHAASQQSLRSWAVLLGLSPLIIGRNRLLRSHDEGI